MLGEAAHPRLPVPDHHFWASVAERPVAPPPRNGTGVVMAQVLQFPYPTIVFDPDTVKIVSQAFDDAWKKIEKSGNKFAKPAYANAMREEIAKHIIDMAGRGERDQNALVEDAILFLAENYKY
jgi:hypothetical protein